MALRVGIRFGLGYICGFISTTCTSHAMLFRRTKSSHVSLATVDTFAVFYSDRFQYASVAWRFLARKLSELEELRSGGYFNE